ncbi:uncharacterized protein [Ptychodera flava]|uniref:uncharacterized protein n=1 Tax=Ptychodera flava TaxID=63121 RepID=UPI00396A0C2C
MIRQGVTSYCIGVDVGGTNTDAAVVQGDVVVGFSKTCTTEDITSGVIGAIHSALQDANVTGLEGQVSQVNIGTTHFIDAVIQRKNLTKVSVIRLCGPASTAVPPFSDFPEDLTKTICGSYHFLNGGYQYDGKEITAFDGDELRQCVNQIKDDGITQLVVCGVFSPINPNQELKAAEILQKEYPELSFTLSHKLGQLGILERENAAILNESLKPFCLQTITAFKAALRNLELNCPFFLTQNDGVAISTDEVVKLPLSTFLSGSTNSMRGAAFLSGVRDAIVIDIGGTSSEFGLIKGGFPRQASAKIKVGDVRINFPMPDVLKLWLGGGSHVTWEDTGTEHQVVIGPMSCGYKLTSQSMVFGEATGKKVLTATDIAVAAGLVDLGDPTRGHDLDKKLVSQAVDTIHSIVESAVDQIKGSPENQPVILVGGGSILIQEGKQLKGASTVIKPPHFDVANAVGAALCQVSGEADIIIRMDEVIGEIHRQKATEEELKVAKEKMIRDVKVKAIQSAEKAGVDKSKLEIQAVEEILCTYQTGNAIRYKVKAVGPVKPHGIPTEELPLPSVQDEKQARDNFDTKFQPTAEEDTASGSDDCSITTTVRDREETVECTEPLIDEKTGEWILSEWDLDCIAFGAGILGCGGRGNPYIGKLKNKRLLKAGKKIKIIAPERINKDGLIVIIGGMGAPLVLVEKLCNDTEALGAICGLQDLLYNLESDDGFEIQEGDGVKFIDGYIPRESEGSEQVEKHKTKITGILCAEIGGMNSMEPLYIGALQNLPVIDADCMGRAFPEFQMTGPFIYGREATPCCIADEKGRKCVVLQADSPKHIEKQLRHFAIEMGSKGYVACAPLSKEDVISSTVLYSLSQACKLGRAVLAARKEKKDPIEAVLRLENGNLLIKGKVSDIARTTSGGFDKGKVTVEGFGEFQGSTLTVEFKNEFLVAWFKSYDDTTNVAACVPDLISCMDSESGEPITTDEVKYGLRVAVVVLPSSPLLRTPRALQYVGPQAFGEV